MKIKTIILMFTLLTVSTTATGLFMYYSSIKAASFKEDHIASESHTKTIKNAITQMISRYDRIALSLSRHSELALALKDTSEANLNRANKILDLYNTSMETSVCYLLNINGIAIASSNRNDTDSFVGKDYSFRPYFNNSIIGNPFVYMALGVTSGRRGIYFSSPIYESGSNSIIGVSVIKEDVDKIETENLAMHYPTHVEHHDALFISNEDSVIFISGQKNLLFYTVWQINNDEIKNTASSMQFGKGPWPWAGFTKISEEKVIDQSGRHYNLLSETIKEIPNWQIIHLSDSDAVTDRIHESFFKTSGYVVLFVFTIIGSVLFILNSLANKTEKDLRNSREVLPQSEEKHRLLFESAGDAIFIHDREGRMLEINPTACEMLGYSHAELMSMTIDQVDTPEEAEYAPERIAKLMEQGHLTFETVHQRKDSSHIPIEVNARRITWNKKSAMMSICRDTTERKRSEEERKNLISELTDALGQVKKLSGLLPICMHCKKIRDDKGYWNKIEAYLGEHSEVEFSHSICQECSEKYYPEMDLYGDDES